jgi:hypothetical protein
LIYRDLKQDQENMLKSRSRRSELAGIQKIAADLAHKIESLTEPTKEFLWDIQSRLHSEVFRSEESKSRFGHTIIRHQNSDGAVEIRYLNEFQIVEAVHVLNNLANHAVKTLGREKTGPVPDEALRMWVINMENLFVKILGRKFTHNPHKDETTIAYLFCKRAIEPLDPTVAGSALRNAMRKAIKLSGQVLRPKSRLAARKIARSKS